jgi:hypothetical protein
VAIDCGVSSEIGFEEHAVADIDHEILLAAGRRTADSRGLARIVGLVRAAGRGQRQCKQASELHGADDTYNNSHSGALPCCVIPDMPQV